MQNKTSVKVALRFLSRLRLAVKITKYKVYQKVRFQLLAWLCCISCVFFMMWTLIHTFYQKNPGFSIGLLVKMHSTEREQHATWLTGERWAGGCGAELSWASLALHGRAWWTWPFPCLVWVGASAARFRKLLVPTEVGCSLLPARRFTSAGICVQMLSCTNAFFPSLCLPTKMHPSWLCLVFPTSCLHRFAILKR